MKLGFGKRLQWVAAVAVAATAKLLTAAFSVWRAARAKDEQTVSDELYQNRMAVCRNCPVYYAPLATCGTPLRKAHREVGCYCYLPALARLKETHCWLREQGMEDGWPDELMPDAGSTL